MATTTATTTKVPLEQERGLALEMQHIDDVSDTHGSPSRTSPASSLLNLHMAPLPNPPFVFPARETTPPAVSMAAESPGIETQSLHGFTPSSPINISRTRSAPLPLPVFSFNPSRKVESVNELLSPPLSPQSAQSHRSSPSRLGGHRRGGSELIGGDGKSRSGVPLMSTSPLSGDGVLSTQNANASTGPAAGRRGHSHRRSAAISCHDIATISRPDVAVPMLSGSAPTSPSDILDLRFSFPRSKTWSGGGTHSRSVSAYLPIQTDSPPASPRVQNRTRVGFSDTLEFIPRPLSLISSDASSTTTIKPNHSLSGSLSSIASVAAFTISTPEVHGLPSPASTVHESDKHMDNEEAIRDLSLDHSMDVQPKSYQEETATTDDVLIRPLTPRSPLKYLFFGQDARSEHSSEASRPASPASERSPTHSIPSLTTQCPEADSCAPKPEQRSSPGKHSLVKKTSKKKKRVRSWAGSILTKRSRQRSQKTKIVSRRSPTPPLSMSRCVVVGPKYVDNALDDEAQDHEDKLLRTLNGVSLVPNNNPTTDSKPNFSNWTPRHVSIADEEDNARDIIDLDAAMGPFNTPSASSYDPLWEEAQREAPKSPRRRMHSGAVARGYMRKDLTFHRRSESAPEMENPHHSLHRLGSNSTMADVFEEDEEDENVQAGTPVLLPGPPQKALESILDQTVITPHQAPRESMITMPTFKSKYSGEQLPGEINGGGKRLKREGSLNSDTDAGTADISGSSSFVGDENFHEHMQEDCSTCGHAQGETESLCSSKASMVEHITSRSDGSTRSYQETSAGPSRSPLCMPSTLPFMSQSPLPSPRSPLSYDAMQISADQATFNNEGSSDFVSHGKFVHDTRVSVDDVPSLTSTRSTMTRGSQGNPNSSYTQSRSGNRSASPGAVSMTGKRSSIASLSRLLNSTHGSKSKLSLQEAVSDATEPKTKVSKGKRLSRLMQFWRAKDESDLA